MDKSCRIIACTDEKRIGDFHEASRKMLDEGLKELTVQDDDTYQGTRSGINLTLEDVYKRQQLLLSDQDLKPAACQDSRNKQRIGKLLKLKPGEITTLQQLADSLYLSPPTVGGLLRDVAGWFSERSLRIVSMRSKGVCLSLIHI